MATILACIIAAALVLYALLAGADYGAGLWDLLSSGPDKEEQNALVASAIDPIWEANHVWLILILVLLFAGFPPAFGAIMTALTVPILVMLAGIVLRGSSFVFRAFSTLDSEMQRACGYVFSASSCFTPFFGGVILGAISDDSILVSNDASTNGYLLNWLNPFTVSCGLMVLALCAFLAAAYLTVEAKGETLRRSFRIRAGAAALASAVLTIVTLSLAGRYAPGLASVLLHSSLARGFEIGATVFILLACTALYRNVPRLARVAAAAHVSCVAITWAVAQYPYLARPNLTIFNSIVSANVVRDIVIACFAGAVLLFPSLGLLLYTFKHQKREASAASSRVTQQ